jgi:metal-responsive CopG/Arc/MetJ family transcriptional regulator
MKKTEQIGIRLTDTMFFDLEVICKIEGVDKAELVRGWIREKISERQKDKRYKKAREELLAEREAAGPTAAETEEENEEDW